MGVLAEYLRAEAEQLREELHKREEAVREWLSAVGQLYDRLERWARDADGGVGLLCTVRMPRVTLQEPRLGVYELDCLRISLGVAGNRRAEIRPRARYVVATIKPPGEETRRADGTVEIRGAGGVTEYYLFRLKGPGEDRWYIQSHARWHSNMLNNDVEELSAERFEAAMLQVLQ
ncbi:hypothetical protein R5W24_006389 [Gemmata sp. JC717]|uniref:hypothetical protein n=1 Tax=Gemmata algarum TaxID=2975278 RepID=UPI0021BB8084|nr:hypothetical protein [Gemmata algarum]MDY3557202.1 hypothetical protein [Gemmata algarum]